MLTSRAHTLGAAGASLDPYPALLRVNALDRYLGQMRHQRRKIT
jgi:hypothetical protein